MSDAETHDAAALVVINACRMRLIDALLPVMEAEADMLMAQGHAEVLVCQAMISAAAEMLGHVILDNCEPADVAAGRRAPVGTVLQ